MAKLAALPDLLEMEKKLGHSPYSSAQASSVASRYYYTDLKPVPDDSLQQFTREYVESLAMDFCDFRDAELRLPLVMECSDNSVCIAHLDHVGLHRISIDIVLSCGLTMALLCTEADAQRAQACWRVCTVPQPSNRPEQSLQPCPDELSFPIFRLPLEIRERIYHFAMPNKALGIKEVQSFTRCTFPSALGDPSGLSFQLGQEPSILQVSRQMRHEALAIAYRKTKLILDDMDDLVRLLVAIGQVGRDNVTSLQFPWTSRSEIASRWEERPGDDDNDNDTKLPTLHTMHCVQLLQSCKRLHWLTVCIEHDMMETSSELLFIADPGLTALVALKQVGNFKIVNEIDESLEEHRLIKLLRQEVQGLKDAEKDSTHG